jgi:hypothetical protein
VGVIAVKPCRDTAVDFEFAETTLDEITLGVELFVVPVLVFAGALGWDNCLHSFGSDERSNLVGIIAFIGNHRLGRLSGQQRRGTLAVRLLPSGQQQAQWSAQGIAEHMNFRSQSTTGSPQSLLTRPLFPVAACWWALTRVESIIT